MRAPWEVAEVAELLRQLARCTGKVRTGIGRARQDVNVSVEGGTRVEIKGVHRIPYIPRLTHFEALRQANLLELRGELHQRGITAGTLRTETAEVSEVLKNTPFSPILRALERGWQVMAVRLSQFSGLLKFPLQPGRDFAAEVSDRVRVIACLDELPNILHSEMMDNPLSPAEWKKVGSLVRAKKDDAVVLVWGDARDVDTAVGEIAIRAREATEGIPNETRQAFPSGINGFERILPGPDRMYPDTDMPPVPLAEERIERARGGLPPTPWERREFYRRLGLSAEVAATLALDARAPLFHKIVGSLPVNPTLAAVIVGQMLKSLGRKGFAVAGLDETSLIDLFRRFAAGEFGREAFPDILKMMAVEAVLPADAIAALGIFRLGEEDVREIVQVVARVERTLEPREPAKKFRYLMGVLMAELRGRVDGAKAAALLGEALGAEG
jgi:glutamyl-tRNA(Gln) amidotransferase subunit E